MVYVILVVIVTKVSSLCFYFLLIWIQMFSVAYTSYGKLSALYFSSSVHVFKFWYETLAISERGRYASVEFIVHTANIRC